MEQDDKTDATTPAGLDHKKALESVTKRERYIHQHWVKDAAEIQSLYLGDKREQTPFNILYSNTEIVVPATFSQLPTPVVRKRFGEEAGAPAAQVAQRYLTYILDSNRNGQPGFKDIVEDVVLDAALPGQGQLRLRVGDDRIVTFEYVPWDRFTWGYARRWEAVPWVAFRHDMTAEDIISTFSLGPEASTYFSNTAEGGESSSNEEGAGVCTYAVYELYDKASRTIRFLCDQVPEKLLLESPDTYQLEGFFPCPPPLRFVKSTVDTMPRPLYNLYRQQAEELNALTTRIKRVTQAIRVRGIYNGNIPELATVLSGADLENGLVPANDPTLLNRTGGLDQNIWLVPTEKLVQTLRELLTAREAIKGVIYEILGIGDILRGVSRASETLGAQQIKDKWGSLRINKVRNRVTDFIKQTLRMAVELGATQTPEEVWQQVTQYKFASSMAAALAQQQGQPLEGPSWPQVLSQLQSDTLRSYLIDVELNSTVDSEATQDKQDFTEFLTAAGQALSTLSPLAAQSEEGFMLVKRVMLEMAKIFRFSEDFTSIISAMQSPQSKGMDPEMQRRLEELKQKEQELQQREQAVRGQEEMVTKKLLAAQKTEGEIGIQQGLLDGRLKTFEQEVSLIVREAKVNIQEFGKKEEPQNGNTAPRA